MRIQGVGKFYLGKLWETKSVTKILLKLQTFLFNSNKPCIFENTEFNYKSAKFLGLNLSFYKVHTKPKQFQT